MPKETKKRVEKIAPLGGSLAAKYVPGEGFASVYAEGGTMASPGGPAYYHFTRESAEALLALFSEGIAPDAEGSPPPAEPDAVPEPERPKEKCRGALLLYVERRGGAPAEIRVVGDEGEGPSDAVSEAVKKFSKTSRPCDVLALGASAHVVRLGELFKSPRPGEEQ